MPDTAWKDQIVAEVREVREAHAAKFDFNLHANCLDIKRQEHESGRTYGFRPARKAEKPAESGSKLLVLR